MDIHETFIGHFVGTLGDSFHSLPDSQIGWVMTVREEQAMGVTSAPASLINEAHRQSLRVSIREAATVLRDVLTPGVVAYLTGVDATKTVARWASGETARLQEEHATRLRVAFELVEILTQFDAAETVRNWFVGSNPQLDDEAPATVLREGRFGEARAAALAFAAGG